MTQKGPTSFHDLMAAFSTHAKEDSDAFEGMGKAINRVAEGQAALDSKQDEQIASLKTLLAQSEEIRKQAEASAEERGRRIESERLAAAARKRKEKRDANVKWAIRFVAVPVLLYFGHLLTKWLHL